MRHITFHLDDGRDIQIHMGATDSDLKGIVSSFAPLERVALQAALRRLADYLTSEGVLILPAGVDAQTIEDATIGWEYNPVWRSGDGEDS